MPIEHVYSDARTEAEPLLRAAGVRPSAVLEFLDQFAPQFIHIYDATEESSELIYRGSDPAWKGLSLPEAIATLKESRPHYFYKEPDGIAVLAEEAFGARPSLTARGKLIRELGSHEAYLEMASRWGSDGTSLKPGARPGSAEAKARETAEPEGKGRGINNPWLKANWSITRQGEVVKALGVDKATAIAKAADSCIGATKPTR